MSSTPIPPPPGPAVPDDAGRPSGAESAARSAPAPGPQSGTDAGTGTGPRVTREQVSDVSRLRRTTGPDRRLAGVAGGLARHLDVDPLLIRVALAVLVLFGGTGLIVYAACWLFVPEDGRDRAAVALDVRSRGVALLGAAGLATAALVFGSVGHVVSTGPLVALAVVTLLVLAVLDPVWHSRGARPPVGPAPGAPGAPGPAAVRRPAGTGWSAAAELRRARRRGPVLLWFTLAAALVGCLALLAAAGAGARIPLAAYPALVLACCGAMLVVGSVWGRGGGLVAVGLLAALALLLTALAGPWHGAGEQRAAPPTASAVASSYQVTAGQIVLDLTRMADPSALAGRTVHLDATVGQIEVIVPPGLAVTTTGRIRWAGQASLFDRQVSGTGGFSFSGRHPAADDPGGASAPLHLDASVGSGQVVVRTEGDDR